MAARLSAAVAAVRRAVRVSCADLEPGQRVVVACSGGADSMALAAATLFESRAAGWLAGAAIVDHQLQPGSAAAAAGAAARLTDLGFEAVETVTVHVGTAGGPEGAARSARYAALTSVAEREDAVVLLGHSRDDQAESVLLGLMRGSGLRSLAGMPPARGRFRRPLLHVSRAETQQACEDLGLDVWDDPHNRDDRYARVRVRRAVLPVLERELGPGVAEALARTADLARADADALDVLAEQLSDEATTPSGGLSVEILSGSLAALRRRVLRRHAIAAGSPAGEVSAGHVEAMERLVTDWHGQHGVDLPGHRVAIRDAGELRTVASAPAD